MTHAICAATLLLTIAAASRADFGGIDVAAERAIEAKELPGAVVLLGKGDEIVFEKAYGSRSVQPTTRPMTTDTIFDLASLSKCVGTATSVMLLADRGKIDLAAPVATYLPAFGVNGKEAITVEQLLLHRGGMIADNPLKDYVGTRDEMVGRLMALAPTTRPNTKHIYSDVGFEVLGELVARVSGRPLDEFARDEVFKPLGMYHTGYNPPPEWREVTAPTERRGGEWMVGSVHDPRAFALGGVAGHAGVFSTAGDVSRWVRMLNNGGTLDGKRLLSAAIVKQMLAAHPLPGDPKGTRGLGVDIDSPLAPAPRGNRFAVGTTFGHTGYTGTSFWSDPQAKAYVIILTNRVHPSDAAGKVTTFRREVATIAATELLGPAPTTRRAE